MFSIHKNLYHYTRSASAINYILNNLTLQMGSFENVNDPREAKSWPFTIYARDIQSKENFDSQIFREISDFITKKTLMLCLAQDDPTLTNGDETDLYIRSGYGHPRMWAQYGDNHKGVCLVFDKSLLHKAVLDTVGSSGVYYGPVKYLSTVYSPEGDAFHLSYLEDFLKDLPTALESHIEKYSNDLFFSKHIDWRDEWEYRWVFRSGSTSPIYIPIENCIKAVILGGECPHGESREIKSICDNRSIPLYRIHQHGWAISILEETPAADTLSLNGVSFSTETPCSAVFSQVRDAKGNNRTLRIDTNGEVVILD